MAKYTITHTCDHEVPHTIFGKPKGRERRIGWLRASICRDCLPLAQDTRDPTIPAHWPALQGSDRDIAWALRVRATALTVANLDVLIAMYAGNEKRARAGMGALVQETNARWWVDHRGETIGALTNSADLTREHQ